MSGLDLGRGIEKGLILLVLAVLLIGMTAGCRTAGQPPRLIVDESVSADFEALALETWDQFLNAFWARSDCFGDVRLRAVYSLDSRAGYDPDTATATVLVPGTPAMLQSGLIHEWAHHVEFQCGEHQDLRAAFLAAQGLPPDTPWRPSGEAATSPSEQYAEATIEFVLGTRPIPTEAHLTREAIRVVREWAEGGE
ncbi:MAG: hypothetical protein JXM73_18100 [Anaerolineae bacterium]|nr:hypothetical protein [Anaerolineae bacterium]